MLAFIRSAKRVDVTPSCLPNVISVGEVILPRCDSASCSITAFDGGIKASKGCAGRPRTNAPAPGCSLAWLALPSSPVLLPRYPPTPLRSEERRVGKSDCLEG